MLTVLVLFVIVLVGWFVWAASRNTIVNDVVDESTDLSTCLRDSIAQDNTDYYEQTVVAAREISGTDLAPISLEESWRIAGEDILWNDSIGTIYVDRQWFSDLSVVDATWMDVDDGAVVIGYATDALMERASPSEIIEGLMHAQVIRLYAHLSGYACAVSEETVDGFYTTTYEGEHSYCTNECIDAPLSFTVSLDEKNGLLTLWIK